CFKCQGVGHLAVDFPNRNILSFIEEEGDPKYESYDESNEDEIIYEDQGQSLVVCHMLSIAATNEDHCLRNNIFQMKCMSKGKVCDVIVDGGSCEKLVSITMVEKLGLKPVDHPQPYNLLWFQKGNEVKVNKWCLVQFLIGRKYNDELWCDVVPMDACYILLGRPLQFDCQTKHDGFRITYTFKNDGVTITLGPTDVRKKAKETDSDLLTISEFDEAMGESCEAFLLVVMENIEETNVIPP
ncbi:hypothetical protein CFOL_v3_20220, partial [Cephalotus follicularis]